NHENRYEYDDRQEYKEDKTKRKKKIELEFINEPEVEPIPEVEQLPPQTIPVSSGILYNPLTDESHQNKANMSDVMSKAKEMETQRKSELKRKGFVNNEG